MIRFQCDYAEGAHPAILEALQRTNFEQTPGYGEDVYCQKAADMIRGLCENQDAAVHFLVGGTQVNLLLISAALRPHQAALCAVNGHIFTHEAGAVEATGHKCIALAAENGKISADAVNDCVREHFSDPTHEHMSQPGLAYASISSELGTNYSRAEIAALYAACRKNGLYLYVDGARLACAMADKDCDWDLPFLCRHCDAFTLGGTKAGMLFGEALVISNEALKRDFRYLMKQRGAMLAKGRLLGIQYIAMLETGLYFSLGKHAVKMADQIREKLRALDIPQAVENGTNLIFPVLPNGVIEAMKSEFAMSLWEKTDENHTAMRIVTSWATRQEDVDVFLTALERVWKEQG